MRSCYKFDNLDLNVEESMYFQYIYEQLFYSKDTMSKFYYNNPDQERQENTLQNSIFRYSNRGIDK